MDFSPETNDHVERGGISSTKSPNRTSIPARTTSDILGVMFDELDIDDYSFDGSTLDDYEYSPPYIRHKSSIFGH